MNRTHIIAPSLSVCLCVSLCVSLSPLSQVYRTRLIRRADRVHRRCGGHEADEATDDERCGGDDQDGIHHARAAVPSGGGGRGTEE